MRSISAARRARASSESRGAHRKRHGLREAPGRCRGVPELFEDRVRAVRVPALLELERAQERGLLAMTVRGMKPGDDARDPPRVPVVLPEGAREREPREL